MLETFLNFSIFVGLVLTYVVFLLLIFAILSNYLSIGKVQNYDTLSSSCTEQNNIGMVAYDVCITTLSFWDFRVIAFQRSNWFS